MVTLNEELQFAKNYLNLLQNRFEGALVVNNEVGDTSKYIIPLALQQVLENIVKHNEVSLEHKVEISLKIEADYLIISNTKNEKITLTDSNKSGLKNIEARYAYFTEQKVIVEETENQFTIKLPLLNIDA